MQCFWFFVGNNFAFLWRDVLSLWIIMRLCAVCLRNGSFRQDWLLLVNFNCFVIEHGVLFDFLHKNTTLKP